jgi:hypothetical protein
MSPFEFVIPERPVSQQARRQTRLREWKEFVAEHARSALNESPTLATEPVALRLLYLYDEAALDVDNILNLSRTRSSASFWRTTPSSLTSRSDVGGSEPRSR